jgi:choline dehydrogenase-like flavoprotein
MARRRHDDDVLGARGLTRFDFCIVGSGAGGGTAAYALAAGGKNVLVLEAGGNPFPRLDDKRRLHLPLHSNDEVKYEVREYIDQWSDFEPRTFRADAGSVAAIHDDVNLLPKVVGGAFTHADCKTPRYNVVDFQLRSTMEALIAATPGLAVPGFGSDAGSANFADWPFTYDDLLPFYIEAERLYGVQGRDGDNPYESPRGQPYPMPPGVPMYFALRLAAAAAQVELPGHGPLQAHSYPASINSRFFDGRPPCVDCGYCSGFGCPNNAKGSPAVTALRKALVSGRCQLRYNAQVVALRNDGGTVTGIDYVDGDGNLQTAVADAYILAASPIESARLCFLSPTPSDGVLGNGSDQVGRNLMCHFQTNVNGFLPERVHGDRGRAVTNGITDFRGVERGGAAIRVFDDGGGKRVAMGGICEFSAPQGLPITEDGEVYAFQLGLYRRGQGLKNVLRDLALGQHLFGILMQAEDAPQLTNRVDLDPTVRDGFGRPVPRITYASHPYELEARRFYVPFMRQVVAAAGSPADRVFLVPCDATFGDPPSTRHVMGTLRMGTSPATSVTDAYGRFHDVANLYAVDGSVFPTSSGYNPTLTLIAVALRTAHHLAGTAPAV